MMDWYEAEVRQMEARNRKLTVRHPVVFYGSSSIRLWTEMAADLNVPKGINCGFGGSTLEACVYFFERLVTPLRPCSLFVYAGDNDLGDGHPAEHVLAYYRAMAAKVAHDLPSAPFGFLSIKPSPAREKILPAIQKANELIHAEAQLHPNAFFVDTFDAMLRNGRPRPELFQEDGLHLNVDGYTLWTELLTPYRHKIVTEDCPDFDRNRVSFKEHGSGVLEVVQPQFEA